MNEERIIALAKTGDQRAFGELVDRYQRFVWNVALKMTGDHDDASDITQEVFVTVWQKLAQFQGTSSFSTWLYRVTTNKTLGFIKSQATRQAKHSRAGMEPHDNGNYEMSNPTASIEKSEAEKALTRLLAKIDPDRRMALILREIEGLSYTEIASATDAPIGTVRSRIARGRRELESQARTVRETA